MPISTSSIVAGGRKDGVGVDVIEQDGGLDNYLIPPAEYMHELVDESRNRQQLLGEATTNAALKPRRRTFLERLKALFLGPPAASLAEAAPDNKQLVPLESTKPRYVALGVHGWFPNKWLQRVIGVPRGTSDRLSAKMRAVCGGKAIALEGEGQIMERVALHCRQAEEQRELLRDATDLYFVAHSQGAPVAALLIDRLISEGIVSPVRQRVGFLALAGIFQGPLPALKSNLVVQYVEAEAARELFELNNPESDISQSLQNAMQRLLSAGVRVMVAGSWLDQVVPIYSSTMLALRHPGIYRTLYVDRANYRPDFLTHLTRVALKLINRSDSTDANSVDQRQVVAAHLLLAHLTPYLSGQLLSGNAHSTVYDEDTIYSLAHTWFSAPTQRHVGSVIDDIIAFPVHHAGGVDNPSFIPWIIRGMLLDRKLHDAGFKEELDKLVDLYGEWQPVTKELKELKRRLKPLQSKL